MLVTDSVSTDPITGAIVSIVDRNGATKNEGLTSRDGTRLLEVPTAGVYRVRVRRIGYMPYLSDTVTLERGQPRSVKLAIAGRRITLPAIEIVADRKQCEPGDPAARLAAAGLWESIRTALAAGELTRRDSPLEIHVETFERTLDQQRRAIARHRLSVGSTRGPAFFTPPPEALSRNGYVVPQGEDLSFYGPDAAVVLSPEFETDHCFGIVFGGSSNSGMVGLTFQPHRSRQVADIAGTLWVDTATTELRRIDYTYVDAPTKITDDSVGGHEEFIRLPSGASIVSAWVIRMPRIEERATDRGLSYALIGYLERGGVATLSADALLAVSLPHEELRRLLTNPVMSGRIKGVVYDSLLNHGLAHASVRVDGLTARSETDSSGHFELDSIPSGRYRVTMQSPVLDSLGFGPITSSVEVVGGKVVAVTLATPSLSSAKNGMCADSAALLTGVVRDADTGIGVGAARVELSWLIVSRAVDGGVRAATKQIVAPTDTSGRYLACVAPSAEIWAMAAVNDRQSGRVTTEIGPRRFDALDLYVDEADAMRTTPPSSDTRKLAILDGYVRDSLARPIRGATVAIDDVTLTATTDSTGFFALPSALAGSRGVTIHRIGYSPIRIYPALVRSRRTNVTIVMRSVTTLEAVEVTAAADTRFSIASEFNRRKKSGTGYLFGPVDLAALHPSHVETVLQNAPTVFIQYWPADKHDTTVMHLHPPGSLVVQFQNNVSLLQKSYCDANIYIDGHYTEYQDDLRSISPDQIAAVEVYKQSSSAPQQYVNLRNGCGVILIWTKAVWSR